MIHNCSEVFPKDSFEPEGNEKVYSNFLKELEFVDSQYPVKFPFKMGTYVFPDNYSFDKSHLIEELQ